MKDNNDVRRRGRLLRGRPSSLDDVLTHLGTEDLEMMRWLLRYPLSRVEDLSLVRGVQPSTTYRHIARLEQLYVVERVRPPLLGARSCELYHLSNLGVYAVATTMQRQARELAERCCCDERSLQRWLPRIYHLITLQDVINGIDMLAPEKLGLLGRRAQVWWECIRDYRHPYTYRRRSMICEADGAVVLQVRHNVQGAVPVPDRWYSLFIVLDNGIQSVNLIRQRLRALLWYRECPERWATERSYYHYFPSLLIIATTRHRRDYWLREAHTVTQHIGAKDLQGAITTLEEMHNPASKPQFPWHLQWLNLANDRSCHLQDVLEPMPREAIPPGMILPHEWMGLDVAKQLPSPPSAGREALLPLVVRGQFTQRAATLQQRGTGVKDKREPIALLSLRISARLLDLLTYLLDRPLLSIEEIAAFLDLKESSVQRYIRELDDLGCLQRVDTNRYREEMRKRALPSEREHIVVQDDIGQRWFVSAQGIRLLTASHAFNLYTVAVDEEEKHTFNEAETLIQKSVAGILRKHRIEHNAGMYGFFADLCRAAERERDQGREHHLLWWDMGVFIERRYSGHERMHNLRPDAMGEYKVGKRPSLLFWLEWDRNTMKVQDLQKKFDSYSYYIASREYNYDKMRLPWLLIVVPERDQELRVVRIVKEKLGMFHDLTVRITTASRLARDGPLGEIWFPILPAVTPSDASRVVQRSQFFESNI